MAIDRKSIARIVMRPTFGISNGSTPVRPKRAAATPRSEPINKASSRALERALAPRRGQRVRFANQGSLRLVRYPPVIVDSAQHTSHRCIIAAGIRTSAHGVRFSFEGRVRSLTGSARAAVEWISAHS